LEIKNADERRQIGTRQAVLHGAEFKALWDRIKHKTTYRVQFDKEKLIESCIRAVNDGPSIARTRLQWRKADSGVAIDKQPYRDPHSITSSAVASTPAAREEPSRATKPAALPGYTLAPDASLTQITNELRTAFD
jgi:restriction endonuclease